MNFVSHGQGGDSAVVVEVARSAGINASINATLRMNASSTVAICEAHAGIETGLLLNAAVGGQGAGMSAVGSKGTNGDANDTESSRNISLSNSSSSNNSSSTGTDPFAGGQSGAGAFASAEAGTDASGSSPEVVPHDAPRAFSYDQYRTLTRGSRAERLLRHHLYSTSGGHLSFALVVEPAASVIMDELSRIQDGSGGDSGMDVAEGSPDKVAGAELTVGVGQKRQRDGFESVSSVSSSASPPVMDLVSCSGSRAKGEGGEGFHASPCSGDAHVPLEVGGLSVDAKQEVYDTSSLTLWDLAVNALEGALVGAKDVCSKDGTHYDLYGEAMEYLVELGLASFVDRLSTMMKAGTQGLKGMGWLYIPQPIGAPSGKCPQAESTRLHNEGMWYTAFQLQSFLNSEHWRVREVLGSRLVDDYATSRLPIAAGSNHRGYCLRRTVALVIGRFEHGVLTNFTSDPASYFVKWIADMFMSVLDSRVVGRPPPCPVQFPLCVMVKQSNMFSWLADIAVLATIGMCFPDASNLGIISQAASASNAGHEVGEQEMWRCMEEHGLSKVNCTAIQVDENRIGIIVLSKCDLGMRLRDATETVRDAALSWDEVVLVVDARDGTAEFKVGADIKDYGSVWEQELKDVLKTVKSFVGGACGVVLPCDPSVKLSESSIRRFEEVGGRCVTIKENRRMVSQETVSFSKWLSVRNPIVEFCCAGALNASTIGTTHPRLVSFVVDIRKREVEAAERLRASPNQQEEDDQTAGTLVALEAHSLIVKLMSKMPLVQLAQFLTR